MREAIKLYDEGDCVEVTVLDLQSGAYNRLIGLVLGAQTVDMDEEPRWLYTIAYGENVEDFWEYEIRPVNSKGNTV